MHLIALHVIDALMVLPEEQFDTSNGSAILNVVNCTGNEREIFQCNISLQLDSDCINNAGLSCSSSETGKYNE